MKQTETFGSSSPKAHCNRISHSTLPSAGSIRDLIFASCTKPRPTANVMISLKLEFMVPYHYGYYYPFPVRISYNIPHSIFTLFCDGSPRALFLDDASRGTCNTYPIMPFFAPSLHCLHHPRIELL